MLDINMKTKNIKLAGALFAALLLGSCEKVSMEEIIDTPPAIQSFSPAEGYAGSKVTVKGSSLHNVVAAKIGDEDAEIDQRISNSQIVIKVPAMAATGKITLSNAVGSGESADFFTMTYPAPEADLSSLPASVDLGGNLLIFGKKMSVISRVLFSAPGFEAHEAEIVSQNDSEIVVKIPFVEGSKANISFEYFDGNVVTATDPSLISVSISRLTPKVNEVSATEGAVGDVITLTGENLDKVDRVLLGGVPCIISQQSPESLKFVITDNPDFTDGDNYASLQIDFFDGVEKVELKPNFKISVSAVLFWKDITLYAQGRDVEEFTSFFSPQTGMAYANATWRQLDPISFANQGANCSAAQVPASSQKDYDSVIPYFFFTGVSAGHLQINSPAGSATMLRNIYTENNSAVDFRVTGANADCYGTPVLTFLALEESNAAHKELIDQVRNGTLSRLDESNYPIDTQAKKCGDISISSMSNSLNNTKFAPDVFTVGQNKNTDVDSYILVLYYNHKGLDTSNRSLNVRRMGVLHIKHINFRTYNNTDAPSSSAVTFDMYWMKRDYTNQ